MIPGSCYSLIDRRKNFLSMSSSVGCLLKEDEEGTEKKEPSTCKKAIPNPILKKPFKQQTHPKNQKRKKRRWLNGGIITPPPPHTHCECDCSAKLEVPPPWMN